MSDELASFLDELEVETVTAEDLWKELYRLTEELSIKYKVPYSYVNGLMRHHHFPDSDPLVGAWLSTQAMLDLIHDDRA